MAVGTLNESHKLVITFQPEFFVFMFFGMSRSKWEVFRGVTYFMCMEVGFLAVFQSCWL
jgi:hypothetical protein